MLINLIWYYIMQLPEHTRLTFWIELDGHENYQRLIAALPPKILSSGLVEIKQLPLKITSIDHSSPLRKAFRLFAKLYRHPGTFARLGIDSVIILGGDDISEYYKKWMILSDLYRIYRYSKKFPVILAGQTIGPFKGLREKVAALCLSKTVIYSRDELTFSYLKDRLKLSGMQIHSSADLCFPELPKQEETNGILESIGLKADRYITLVPGGYFSLYTSDRKAYIDSWAHLIKELLNTEVCKKRKILLLPHVTRPEDDREMILAIQHTLVENEADSERLCIIAEEMMPHELRFILGNGHLTISSRMHAALSTFQMRKPAIALGYSVKYEGVIGRSVRCPELVVPCSAGLLTDPRHFAFEILAKTNYIEENYQQLTAHLETRIPRLKVMAEEQIREICHMQTGDHDR